MRTRPFSAPLHSLLLAVAALLMSNPTKAVDYVGCVDSVEEIEDAIVVATLPASPFTRVIVHVEQGTYNLSTSSLLRSDNQPTRLYRSVQLLGGYSNNCVTRTLNASNTVFTNSGAKRWHWEPKRDLVLQGFTFSAFANAIDIDNFDVNEVEQRIDISHNRFIGGTGQIDISAEAGLNTSLITLKNNIIYGRSTDTNCVLRIFGDSSDDTSVRLVVSNNTFTGNSGGDMLCFGLIDIPSFYNNIFFTNSGDDIVGNINSTGPVVSYNNTYQSTDAITFLVNQNNNSSNPLFVNYTSGDLRLQSSSPAANQGFGSVPYGTGSVDVGGLPRVVGTSIDRGAHESNNSGLFILTVTNTNNSGAGSLREAITLANGTPGLNGIFFNIPGSSCPKVIEVTSLLPEITESLVIDGGTQPGSVANSSDIGFNGERCVLLHGGSSDFGLRVSGAAVPDTQLVVDSMAFGGFAFSILLQAGNGHIIRGSHFGVDLGGTNNAGTIGVYVAASDDVQIGGDGANERNVFANQTASGDVTGAGLLIGSDAARTEVINNYFGTEPNGALPGDNSYGIVSDGTQGVFSDNLIANSAEYGIWLREDASQNQVTYSRLGLPVICLGTCPTSSHNSRGILIEGQGNRVRNSIVASNQVGVRVTGNDNQVSTVTAFGGAILSPPIDIAASGFSANDNDVTLTPPGNRGLNYPVLTSAVSTQVAGESVVQVSGSMQSANDEYRIYLYASDRRLAAILGQGYRCEGVTYLGYTSVIISNATASANGSASFSINVSADQAQGRYITAQAVRRTSVIGLGDSSEFGGCLEAPLFGDGFE